MATTITARRALSPDEQFALRKPRSLWSDAWHQFRRHNLAMAGVFALGLLVVATLIGPFVWTEPTNLINFSGYWFLPRSPGYLLAITPEAARRRERPGQGSGGR